MTCISWKAFMPSFDASSMIHAWDEYPINQFPGLWDWMKVQIESKEFLISQVAFEEVVQLHPECGKWLNVCNIQKLSITNITLQKAMVIKNLLGIENDKFQGDGVGENDILIISSAKEHFQELISNERRQLTLPQQMKRYKIPAVCNLPDVNVQCLNFIEIIKRSKEVFR